MSSAFPYGGLRAVPGHHKLCDCEIAEYGLETFPFATDGVPVVNLNGATKTVLARHDLLQPGDTGQTAQRGGGEFNIVLGLCVGLDSLFYRHSSAPVTTFVVKGRVLGHNPVAALYCPYIRKNSR